MLTVITEYQCGTLKSTTNVCYTAHIMRKTPYEWIKVRVAPRYRRMLEKLAKRQGSTFTELVESWLDSEMERQKEKRQ